jgi:hypothetical protein
MKTKNYIFFRYQFHIDEEEENEEKEESFESLFVSDDEVVEIDAEEVNF